MPKQKKLRCVDMPPASAYYKPQGIPLSMLETTVLTVAEYEAMRLVDYEKMDLEGAAARMNVSRATCARIVEEARYKVAGALYAGRAIGIEGGNYCLKHTRYRCADCGHLWDAALPDRAESPVPACPACAGSRTIDLSAQVGWAGRSGACCYGRGRGGRGRGRGCR